MRTAVPFLVLVSLLAIPLSGATPETADLRLVKSAIDEFAEPGGTLTFSLNVTNLGPGNATGIVVTDPIPPGTEFAGGAPRCSAAAGVITCLGEDLAPGGSFGYSISLRVNETGNVTNTASVRHDGVDPNPANDVSSAEGKVVEDEPWQGVRCSATTSGNLIEWQRLGPAVAYRIERAEGSGPSRVIAIDDASPYLDTNVTSGAAYTYQVFAIRADNSTGASGACMLTAIPEFPAVGFVALALAGSVVAYAALRRRI